MVFFLCLSVFAVLLVAGCFCAGGPAEDVPQSIGLESVSNARELGGYPTRDGKTVKKGVLLRSAALTNLSPADRMLLEEQYHLASVIDLRSSRERAQEPEVLFPAASQHHLKILDEKKMNEQTAKLQAPLREAGKDLVKRFSAIFETGIFTPRMYVNFLQSPLGQEGYRAFFRILLDNPEGSSVLWHCTSGKDRTGIAAMLILGVLNVEDSIIMEDYLLTNTFFAEEIASLQKQLEAHNLDPERMGEYLMVGRGVYAPYMQNALDYILDHYGDIPGYARAALLLSDEDIAKLRKQYTC